MKKKIAESMEENNSNNISTHKDKDKAISSLRPQTYIVIGSEDTGQLEVDLVTARHKNEEIRYLSLSFTGINLKTQEKQEAFLNIDNEEAFEQLKTFFAQLEWNS